MSRPHTVRLVAVLAAVLSVGAAQLSAAAVSSSAAAVSTSGQVIKIPASGSVRVYWRGNGHGHGMSQYGANGAALAGLSTKQILAFYYPHTTLQTLPSSTIRVNISAASNDTTVLPSAGLKVTTYGTLPASGYSRFRLAPSGSGLKLQGRQAGKWKTLKTHLAARADFSNAAKGWVQLVLSDGSSTRYRGTIGAVRSGSGELTINRVSLNLYAQGVAPREMPASWQIAAVRAQAIAARTYAKSSMDEADGSGAFDICDTTMCQVYGGMAHYDSSGDLLYTDDPAAINGYANDVLTYGGSAIFAQYSASNGGATVAGGKPYLVGKTDPYDTAASGDPYLDQSGSVSVAALARSYGLKKVTSIDITKRDGHGPWGGRILTAYVNGTTTAGHAAHLATTGFDLGDAVGAYTDYLRIGATPTAPSAPTAVQARAGDAGATVSWLAPSSSGSAAVTGYQVRFAGHSIQLPASARSTWVGPLNNLNATAVTVLATNAAGAGPAATLRVRSTAAPQPIVAVSPMRLFDTRTTKTAVTAAKPFQFAVGGYGSIPASGVRSVQLAVTVVAPSRSGVLTVASSHVASQPLASIAYRAGHTASATISVPLTPSGTLVFTPSKGHVALLADQESYSAATGSLLTVTTPSRVAKIVGVATGSGSVVSLAGRPGISSATPGVLVAVEATAKRSTWLRIWPNGAPTPVVSQVAVGPNAAGANTLIVPLGTAQQLRIAAGSKGVTARVTLLGTLGSSGGKLETYPGSAIVGASSKRAARTVAGTAVAVPMVGLAQVPRSGVSAVLVQVTVRSAGKTGRLWAYPSDATAVPSAPAAVFAGTGSVTATVLVPVLNSGQIALKTSGPSVLVSLDSIAYITSD